ncbi:MAG: hypothetical protein LBF95_08280 [Treponema sp.]|jgi:hypothetical protein|nr:hypothetical protein [Treponema sp.]
MRFNRLPGAMLARLCFSAAALAALGAGDGAKEAEQQIRNPVWTLAITAFDTSTLSPSGAALARNVMRDLAGYIGKVSYRQRVSEEYAHYEGLARRTDAAAAALALANKRNERDQLIYRGERNWKYRRDVKAIDAEIKKLEENYLKVLNAEIPVEREPAFTLSPQNLEGLFPTAPAAGGEAQFCKNQKLDAILVGAISEYHDRLYVTHKLYVAYVDSYVFQDSILFSSEDLTEAVEEFAGGITLAIAGTEPADLRVSARPEDAQVFLDHAYAGQGYSAGRPPGTVILEVFADNHESVTTELDLKGGEVTEVQVNLRPIELTTLNITVPGNGGAAVYRGSLYMGEAPLSLEIPAGTLEYVFVETPGGEEATAIFLSPAAGALPPAVRAERKGGLFAGLFPSRGSLDGNSLSLVTGLPYDPGQGRVDKARRGSYWAWGGVWVAAISTWLINGHYNAVVNAYNNSPNRTQDFYDRAVRLRTINYIGVGLVGAAVVLDIIQMARYINTAGKDAPVFID